MITYILMMEPAQLEQWRNEVISRLETLKACAQHIRQFMDANDLPKLKDKADFKADFEAAWQKIQDLFPEDLCPNRADCLNRHIDFAEQQDFSDIEKFDIPAVVESVQRYGRTSAAFIGNELERLNFNSSVSDMIHPQIKDACAELIAGRKYQEAARTTIELLLNELRQRSISGLDSDGDALIRQVVGTKHGKLAFSDCQNNNTKQVTDGFKLIIQGLYKGVRNPCSHGWNGFGRVEVFQIMAVSSLLLARLQIVEAEDND